MILLIGATNFPWSFDEAMKRRFEKRIYVPLPDEKDRVELFKFYFGSAPNDLKEFENFKNYFSFQYSYCFRLKIPNVLELFRSSNLDQLF